MQSNQILSNLTNTNFILYRKFQRVVGQFSVKARHIQFQQPETYVYCRLHILSFSVNTICVIYASKEGIFFGSETKAKMTACAYKFGSIDQRDDTMLSIPRGHTK